VEAHYSLLAHETETLFPRRDLARRHKVSIETLKRRERAGLLRALKIGRGVRYRMSDILAFEAEAEIRGRKQ
jgi:hypothetical protein